MYDWTVDIDLITNIKDKGWKVTMTNKFARDYASLFTSKHF